MNRTQFNRLPSLFDAGYAAALEAAELAAAGDISGAICRYELARARFAESSQELTQPCMQDVERALEVLHAAATNPDVDLTPATAPDLGRSTVRSMETGRRRRRWGESLFDRGIRYMRAGKAAGEAGRHADAIRAYDAAMLALNECGDTRRAALCVRAMRFYTAFAATLQVTGLEPVPFVCTVGQLCGVTRALTPDEIDQVLALEIGGAAQVRGGAVTIRRLS